MIAVEEAGEQVVGHARRSRTQRLCQLRFRDASHLFAFHEARWLVGRDIKKPK